MIYCSSRLIALHCQWRACESSVKTKLDVTPAKPDSAELVRLRSYLKGLAALDVFALSAPNGDSMFIALYTLISIYIDCILYYIYNHT